MKYSTIVDFKTRVKMDENCWVNLMGCCEGGSFMDGWMS